MGLEIKTEGAVETWSMTKPAVIADTGLVASQHYLASEAGAQVLRDGGNAIDAAVTASFAIGAVEPWMSGLGGGGYMLVYLARERRVWAVDFGMVTARGLDPADYPLIEGRGSDLFNWPAVVDDRNLRGYPSMAVPTHVAGMALALETFGTRTWAEVLAPAIGLARAGMAVDWYATLKIAAAARDLDRFPESRRVYLPDGYAPAAEWGGPLPRIYLGRLTETLLQLAQAGSRDFYEGDIACAIIADLSAGGSKLQVADLADYRARVLPVEPFDYRSAKVFSAPGLTAGPTLRRALSLLGQRLQPDAQPQAHAYIAYARSLQEAYAERLAILGDSNESAASPSCTTHISVVDNDGNMVALTQTLLSVFGAKVMLPQTGILMNNGMMWFDPRPGRPNSIAPGKRPLSNMCPTIVERRDGVRFAMGASGGRRIMPAVYQLISFLVDYDMSIDAAFCQPRLDVSGTDTVMLDNRLSADIQDAIRKSFSAQTVQHGVYPAYFACPNVIGRETESGRNCGCAFIMSPWAKVASAD